MTHGDVVKRFRPHTDADKGKLLIWLERKSLDSSARVHVFFWGLSIYVSVLRFPFLQKAVKSVELQVVDL